MPNTITAFLERLTAASGEFNSATVSQLGFLDSVYLDVRPQVVRKSSTIRIPFPDLGPFTDQAANDWTTDEMNPGFVDITFGERPGKALLNRDFDSMQTSSDILDQFLTPLYQRAQEYANASVAALINTTKFNAYAPITASKFASISVDDAASAWDLLAGNKVPISDRANASLLYHNNVHRNMLTDASWSQESLVGAAIAQDARQSAAAGAGSLAYNFTRKWDQQAPTGFSSNLTGTIAVANGSTGVTGTSTAFTTQLSAGSWITVGADAVPYRVQSITDAGSLTLTQPYAGTSGSGRTFKRTTYTGIAMHKYAICLAVRPLDLVNDGHVTSRLVMLKGLPIRIMHSYVHQKGGYMLSADFAMVAAVMRPSFGVIIQS